MKRWVLITAVSSEVQIERESLFDQMRKLRLACAQHSGTIVDEIEIPGMSRSFIDWHELKAAAASEGITGFQRIEDHWKARDFDVMAAIDTTRLWRTDALTVYGMARIYEAGGVLFTSRDGFIEAANRSMFSLMAGFQTQKEIETLKARWLTGMKGRLKKGLPPTGDLPFSHRAVLDGKGRMLGVELDPTQRRTLEKLAEIFLDGVPYPKMGMMLQREWGLVHPLSGHPFTDNYFQRLFWTPGFWGHITLNRRSPHVTHEEHYMDWVFGPGAPVPPGVEVEYDAYPAAYQEPLRSDIIAQVRKRRIVNIGRANHTVPYRYTGLLMCAVCQGSFSHELRRYKMGNTHTYRCMTCRRGGQQKVLTIHQDVVDDEFKQIISDVLAGQDIKTTDTTAQQIANTQKQIARTEARIDMLIEEKLDAAAAVKPRYDERLRLAGDELAALQSELSALTVAQFDRRQQVATRKSAAEQIHALADSFWTQPDHKINRLFHLLMGDYRVVIKEGQPCGIELVSFRKFPLKYIRDRRG